MNIKDPALTYARCACTHCDGPIEFDSSYVGDTQPCPHCGQETVLHWPPRPFIDAKPKRPEPKRLTTCPDCDAPVSRSARNCPRCGCTLPSALAVWQIVLRVIGTLIVLSIIILLAAIFFMLIGGSFNGFFR